MGYAFAIALLVSPFVFLYWFLVDPVSAIVATVSTYLWLVVVVIPGFLVLIILIGLVSLLSGFFKSLVNLFKTLFK
jgi:hypothetical protein